MWNRDDALRHAFPTRFAPAVFVILQIREEVSVLNVTPKPGTVVMFPPLEVDRQSAQRWFTTLVALALVRVLQLTSVKQS